MVEWLAFVQVGIATLLATMIVVTLYGLGVRLQAVAEDDDRSSTGYRAGAWICFGLCGVVVLFGIVLIIPALHPLLGL